MTPIKPPSFQRMIGNSTAMRTLFERIERVAQFDVPVLIRGERGTEKHLVATAIHRLSKRSAHRFDAVHGAMFAGVPLLTSDWEAAILLASDGGTLFVDSVAYLSLRAQTLLVDLLDRGEIRPAGATERVRTDVRLVAATSQDLEAAVRSDMFRENLYYLLSHATLDVPPLRARRDDIPLLVEHFLDVYGRKYEVAACPVTRDALATLEAYEWPGNVEELRATLSNALLFHRGAAIEPPDLRLRGSSRPKP
jgi:DNA-binding NtrC family response regulator